MQNYSNFITDTSGNPVAGATVTVTDLASNAVPVYAANAVGANINPITTGPTGGVTFYAPNGRYRLRIELGGTTLAVIQDVQLFDPADGFADGLPQSPGMAFQGDPDTGIRRGGSGVMALVTNSVDRVIINLSGIDVVGTLGADVATFGSDVRLADAVLLLQESAEHPTAIVLRNRNSTQGWSVAVDGSAVDDKLFVLVDRNASVIRFALSPSGNVALGGLPSAWAPTCKAIEFGAFGSLYESMVGYPELAFNLYQKVSGEFAYKISGNVASRYTQEQGMHTWLIAPAGNAGEAVTFTKSMAMDIDGRLRPGTDNIQSLGTGAQRWETIYAGTGAINTSDAREKTAVTGLSQGEVEAAQQLAQEVGGYKFLSAIQDKGDAARRHIGMTVQRAIEVMQAHGLDPFAYGFICYDEWEDKFIQHPAIAEVEAQAAVMDKAGKVITPALPAVVGKPAWTEQTQIAGNRYAFRYDQLNLFIVAGLQHRLEALTARVEVLESLQAT